MIFVNDHKEFGIAVAHKIHWQAPSDLKSPIIVYNCLGRLTTVNIIILIYQMARIQNSW